MYGQIQAVFWAQWRSIWNAYGPRKRSAGIPWGVVFAMVWYGMWTFAAYSIAVVLAGIEDVSILRRGLSQGLLAATVYWQVIPLMMLSTGLSLDLSRLAVYPIPHAHLFGAEVLLRLSACPEMLLMTAGAAYGLLRNQSAPQAGFIALLPFLVFNLLLAAGLRDLFARLLARKHVRELFVLFVILLAASPNLLTHVRPSTAFKRVAGQILELPWPSQAAARIATGDWMLPGITLLAWLICVHLFARWQFERSLRFESAESSVQGLGTGARARIAEWLYRVPSAIFKDPLGALIEKEIRFLTRSARFRLVFIMGFSFGVILFVPVTFRNQDPGSIMAQNYLTLVSTYALLLLGEVCFWNTFGFDRSAAQMYFVAPLKLSTVLMAKNITAEFFVLLEIALVATVCGLLRLPLTPAMVAETFAVTMVLSLFFLAIGNLTSTRSPRAVNPSKSWRGSAAGRVQMFLLLAYPLASAPIFLAYAARYAFDTELAFYGVLLVDLGLAADVYWVSLESAVATAGRRREEIIAALSQEEGPVSA